jgi:hypothetical protein
MNAIQEKMDSNQECLLARMDASMAKLEERMNTNAKANQEDLLAKMDSNQVKAAKQEEMLVEMDAKMYNNQAEMGSIVDEWIMDIKNAQKNTISCMM